MILKASQRGGAKQLGLHLLKTEENEHIEIHELRGFVSKDFVGAFKEAYAISQGTKCRQFLFSVSLNPPQEESVSIDIFEGAIQSIEQKLGLTDQPRAIVLHEKEGRRHAHCVWSRIDAQDMKAINISHFKMKLRDISRELYLKNGWQMPRGFVISKERDPEIFSFVEWQQAKRSGHDPKALKTMFRECWAISDSKAAFASALRERGYRLAQGDRRGFVAIDCQGEIFAIAKWTARKTKEVKAHLGDLEDLPSVEQTKHDIAEDMTAVQKDHIKAVALERQSKTAPLMEIRQRLATRHNDERKKLRDKQEVRWLAESKTRTARLPRGLKGIWTRITGRYRKIRQENERETNNATQRDRGEQQALIDRQLGDRRILQRQVKQVRRTTASALLELHRDIERYIRMGEEALPYLKKTPENARAPRSKMQQNRKNKDRDRGPSI